MRGIKENIQVTEIRRRIKALQCALQFAQDDYEINPSDALYSKCSQHRREIRRLQSLKTKRLKLYREGLK